MRAKPSSNYGSDTEPGSANRTFLIGGHILGMFLVFFTQQLLLVLFGQFVLKVDYFRQPLATLLVMASLALWVAASGLLIAALVKKEDGI